ncbi:beta-propeller fold lactonase family protein [bacterium]|nr:beta-propeller fold lactonase family protein [bacterium]
MKSRKSLSSKNPFRVFSSPFVNRSFKDVSFHLWPGFIMISCLFLVISCSHRTSVQEELDGRVSIMLEMSSHGGEEISINIDKVILKRASVGEEGIAFPLQEKYMLKKSPKQVLLGDFSVAPEKYTGLVISIKEAFLFADGKLTSLYIKDANLSFDIDLDIRPWERKSFPVKLVCGVEKGETEGLKLKPFIQQGKQHTGLRGLRAYVTNESGNSVLIFDRMTGSTLAVVPVGEKPKGIAISPDRTKVYVANSGSGSISVLDTMTSEVTDTIFLGLGVGPEGIAITPDGRSLVTANSRSNNVSLIDLESGRIITHIPAGLSPSRVAISPWGDWAYVTNSRSDDLTIINLNSRQPAGTIALRPWPAGVVTSPSGDEVFVTCKESNVIQVIDANFRKVINVLPTNSGPVDIILDSRRGRIYVADSGSNDISVFVESMNMKTATINVGNSPNALALDDAGRLLYVVNRGDGTVSVVDIGKERVVNKIKVGGMPWGIVIDRMGTG